jgi:hypothetical protein
MQPTNALDKFIQQKYKARPNTKKAGQVQTLKPTRTQHSKLKLDNLNSYKNKTESDIRCSGRVDILSILFWLSCYQNSVVSCIQNHEKKSKYIYSYSGEFSSKL